MVTVDCSILFVVILALFGVEALSDDILWDRQGGRTANTYSDDFVPSEGAANEKTYGTDTRRVTQLVDTPEDALTLMDAMKSRDRRGMRPFSAIRGKRTFSEDDSMYRQSSNYSPLWLVTRGKRMTPGLSPELRYQMLLRQVLRAAMSLSGNQNTDEESNVDKRTFGFHALRGR